MLEKFVNKNVVLFRRAGLSRLIFEFEGDLQCDRFRSHALVIEQFHAGGFLENLGVLDPRPGGCEVDRSFAVLQDAVSIDAIGARFVVIGRFGDFVHAGDEDPFGQIHHREQIAISVVQLQHRKFGIMTATDPFIPEDAANLVHLFDPAHQKTLQWEFERDPKEQRDIKGVVVRVEGACGRSPGDGVQRRRLHLQITLRIQVFADGPQHLHAAMRTSECIGCVDQIEVTVAQPVFFVRHPIIAGRMRFQRFRQERQLASSDGRLAHLRLAIFAINTNEVAEIEQFGDLPSEFAYLFGTEHHLDLAGLVPKVEEVDLAHFSSTDNATGGANVRPRIGVVERIAGEFLNPRDAEVIVEPLAPWIDSQGFELFEFGKADFGVVVALVGRCRFGSHGKSPFNRNHEYGSLRWNFTEKGGCRTIWFSSTMRTSTIASIDRDNTRTITGCPSPVAEAFGHARKLIGELIGKRIMTAIERIRSEQQFHDEQATERAISFRTGRADLKFPDAWYLDHETWIRPALSKLGGLRGRRVLDYGCGHGMAAVVMARAGAEVCAFDLSPGYVDEARERAAANGVRVDVRVANGEELPYPNRHFDAIWGCAILHHLDLVKAAAELRRVLKPSGVAVFCEPWGGNPFLRFARNRLPYPGKHRTPDEKPLVPADLVPLREAFPNMTLKGFQLLGMVRRIWSHPRIVQPLDFMDKVLFATVPRLERWSRYVVLTFSND